MAAVAALALALPFWVRRAVPASRSEHDVEAFRAQLREVETDLSRGVVSEAEAESARIELSRRLLAAAEAAEVDAGAKPAPRRLAPVVGLLAAIGVPVIGFATYAQIGAPTQPDRPLASRDFNAEQAALRPSQEQAEAQVAPSAPPAETPARTEMIALTDRVKERLKEAPEDAKGWAILARSLKTLEIYDESWRAFARVVELDAASADIHANMGEAMFMAAGGYMSPQAEEAIDKALAAEPGLHQAQFFKGIALAQRGEMQPALDGWIKMLRTAPPGAPWVGQVQENVRSAAAELGVEVPTDLVPKGPTAEQRAAAADMSEEDRMEMIAGMVEGLAARLQEEPGDLPEWLMLIRSYRMLGREDEAKAAQVRALEVFSEDDEALVQLKDAL